MTCSIIVSRPLPTCDLMAASKAITTHSLQVTPHFDTNESYDLRGSVLNGSLHY